MIIWLMDFGRVICKDCGFVWPLTYFKSNGIHGKHCDQCGGDNGEVYESLSHKMKMVRMKCCACGQSYGGVILLSTIQHLSCSECNAKKIEITGIFQSIPIEKIDSHDV